MEHNIEQLVDECLSLGARMEDLSDDLSALSNEVRQAKMDVEDIISRLEQEGHCDCESASHAKENVDRLAQQWANLNRALLSLQEHIEHKRDQLQAILDSTSEEDPEYPVLEDALDDLSLSAAELTEMLDDMDALLIALDDLSSTLEKLRVSQ